MTRVLHHGARLDAAAMPRFDLVIGTAGGAGPARARTLLYTSSAIPGVFPPRGSTATCTPTAGWSPTCSPR